MKLINSKIKDLHFKVDKLTQAIIKGVSKKIFILKSKELEDELEQLIKRKEELDKIKNEESKINLETINNPISNFKQLILNGSNEDKSLLIKTFLNRIIVDPENEILTTEFYEFPLLENCYPTMWRRHPVLLTYDSKIERKRNNTIRHSTRQQGKR